MGGPLCEGSKAEQPLTTKKKHDIIIYLFILRPLEFGSMIVETVIASLDTFCFVFPFKYVGTPTCNSIDIETTDLFPFISNLFIHAL